MPEHEGSFRSEVPPESSFDRAAKNLEDVLEELEKFASTDLDSISTTSQENEYSKQKAGLGNALSVLDEKLDVCRHFLSTTGDENKLSDLEERLRKLKGQLSSLGN